jgi:uncharacterized protein
MNCPVCTTTQLTVADRLGIEIDYCPTCRGVWLDRGELDKIIERSLHEVGPSGPRGVLAGRPDDDHGRHGDDHDHRDHDREHGGHDDHGDHDEHAGRYRGPRRRSLLRDLFDF